MTTATELSKEEQDKLRQEWATPDDFYGVVDREFRFQLDAAASKENTKHACYYCEKANALSPNYPWVVDRATRNYATPHRRVWLNPGFANVYPWMEKAYNEAQKHPSAVVVVMALVSPSTKWWRDWAMKASEIRLLTGSKPKMSRVQFVPPEGLPKPKGGNANENCLIIFRPNPHNREPNIWTWNWSEGL